MKEVEHFIFDYKFVDESGGTEKIVAQGSFDVRDEREHESMRELNRSLPDNLQLYLRCRAWERLDNMDID